MPGKFTIGHLYKYDEEIYPEKDEEKYEEKDPKKVGINFIILRLFNEETYSDHYVPVYTCVYIERPKETFKLYVTGPYFRMGIIDLTDTNPKYAAETMAQSPLFGYKKGTTTGATKTYCFTRDGTNKTECNSEMFQIFSRLGSSGLSASFIENGGINPQGIAAAKKILKMSGGKTRRRTGRKGRKGRTGRTGRKGRKGRK